jgi:RHS repeat-associated protein
MPRQVRVAFLGAMHLVIDCGQLDEPGTVAVGSRTVKTGPQNRLALSVPVTTGANTLTLVSTDVNTNSTTNTATFTVANVGSRTFSYDVNGFTTNDGSRTYDWDGAGRLVKIGYAGTGKCTELTYDGLSRRVGLKEVTNNVTAVEQRFVYDGLGIAERRAADGTTVERRYYGQGFEQVGGADAGRYFCVRDHLGSIRALVDTNGTQRSQWSYSLWGSRGTNQVTASPVESDFGYTGHLEHGRSGMVFALYRAYDPGIARWLSRDPIGENGGLNLYGYVFNAPMQLNDPLGLSVWDTLENIADTITGGIAGMGQLAGQLLYLIPCLNARADLAECATIRASDPCHDCSKEQAAVDKFCGYSQDANDAASSRPWKD